MNAVMQKGKRHCGRACYDSKERNCHCICGGINHGKGRKRAVENAIRIAGNWFLTKRGAETLRINKQRDLI